MPNNPVAEHAVRNVLLGVMDPELGDNIVDLGMVQRIGVLDADIGGFSIPRMLGVEGRVQGEEDETGRARFAPLEKPIGLGLLKVMSMGSIEGTGEDQAIMWRVHAEPGRAALPRRRGLGRHGLPADRHAPGHRRHPDGPSPHAAPHRGGDRHHPGAGCPAGGGPGGRHGPQGLPAGGRSRREHERVGGSRRHRYAVFGSGGGERLAEQLGVPLLGSIPLDPAVAAGGDAGEPAAIAAPHTPAAQAFAALAECIVTEAIPLAELVTCTARQFFKAAGLLRTTPPADGATPHRPNRRPNQQEPV